MATTSDGISTTTDNAFVPSTDTSEGANRRSSRIRDKDSTCDRPHHICDTTRHRMNVISVNERPSTSNGAARVDARIQPHIARRMRRNGEFQTWPLQSNYTPFIRGAYASELFRPNIICDTDTSLCQANRRPERLSRGQGGKLGTKM